MTIIGTPGGAVWGQDFDLDGIADVSDNCPLAQNPAQADADGDGCDCNSPPLPENAPCNDRDPTTLVSRCIGGACVGTPDIDRDGILDTQDCILGAAADIDTWTLSAPVVLVDGDANLARPLSGVHRVTVAEGPWTILEFDWDCRWPLLLDVLRVDSVESSTGSFVLTHGLPIQPGLTKDVFLPLPVGTGAPSVCIVDAPIGNVPAFLTARSSHCSAPDEQPVLCGAAPGPAGSVWCVIEGDRLRVGGTCNTHVETGQPSWGLPCDLRCGNHGYPVYTLDPWRWGWARRATHQAWWLRHVVV